MVSGGVPIALGYALALARTEPGAVCFACFGDGAFGEGAVHESLNIASLWRLPVMFICEDNAVAGDDRANAMQSASSLSAIAEVHRVPGTVVDARDAAATVDALTRLTADVRAGAGPRFVDAQTGTWPGNASFFPYDATGPTDLRDAVAPVEDQWLAHDDPVLGECRRLLDAGVTLDALHDVDADVRTEVDAALARALAAPAPPPKVAFADVVSR
jgi:pyruvate dehydrogenase E1 component alpha subunit